MLHDSLTILLALLRLLYVEHFVAGIMATIYIVVSNDLLPQKLTNLILPSWLMNKDNFSILPMRYRTARKGKLVAVQTPSVMPRRH